MSGRLAFALSLSLALAAGITAPGQDPPPQDESEQAAPADTAAEAASADGEAAPFESAAAEISKQFCAGQADLLVGHFLPQGELIDDRGNCYRGADEIQGLLTKYFNTYPGAQLKIEVDSLRLVGSVAVEEGTRLISTREAGDAEVRYITVWFHGDDGWKIASTRELPAADAPAQAQGGRLQPLAWLAGQWVNEGSDAVVTISYRWSDDGNFLLGDYQVKTAGEVTMQSTQRIGWDPQAGSFRSWLFDSDGGYSVGEWTHVDGAWEIKSSSVLPDGSSGSATFTIVPENKDRYTIRGEDRIVGGTPNEDFEVTVTRQPPAPASESASR